MDQTHIYCLAGGFFTTESLGKPMSFLYISQWYFIAFWIKSKHLSRSVWSFMVWSMLRSLAILLYCLLHTNPLNQVRDVLAQEWAEVSLAFMWSPLLKYLYSSQWLLWHLSSGFQSQFQSSLLWGLGAPMLVLLQCLEHSLWCRPPMAHWSDDCVLNTLFQLKVNNDWVCAIWGFPSGSLVKNPPAMQEAQESWVQVPGSGRSPGEGNGNPLQYFCLENSMDSEFGGL